MHGYLGKGNSGRLGYLRLGQAPSKVAVVMEVGTSRGKVGDEVEQRPSAAFWGRDCTPATSGPFFLQPRGLSRQGSLLPVPCSWGQTAPSHFCLVSLLSGRAAKSPPVGRRHPPVLCSYFHNPELHSGQCGQHSTHTVAPLPRFNFFPCFC